MSYQRNRSNSSRSSMTPCAVALGAAALLAICVIGAAVIMRDDFAGAIQNHEKLQEKHQELLTCEDGENCFRRGMHYYEKKEYGKAALDWEKGCDFKNGMACAKEALWNFTVISLSPPLKECWILPPGGAILTPSGAAS